MTLHPAPPDTGIVFHRSDVDPKAAHVPARWENIRAGILCTTLGNDAGTTVGTVEHLMAAMSGCAVDNVLVELNGPEVPVMDGSAEPFVRLAECAGTVVQDSPRRYLRVLKRIVVEEGDRYMALVPAEEFRVRFEIDFQSSAVARQACGLAVTERSFKENIGRARTFGFASDVNDLRARGYARGGTLENSVVVDGETILNNGGLRYEDEFVRHKILDCVGDMYLAGAPVLAEVVGIRSGHSLTHGLLRALFADDGAWRLEAFPATNRAARAPEPRVPAAAVATA
jgi:UDP-3-O-[3-hydroxymyristoyl] N-acetylglucosamine deacetylase